MKFFISGLLLVSGQIVFAESLNSKSVDTFLQRYKEAVLHKDIVGIDSLFDEEAIISDGKSTKNKLDYLHDFDSYIHYCKDINIRYFDENIHCFNADIKMYEKIYENKAVVSMQTESNVTCNKRLIHSRDEERLVIKKIDGVLKIVKFTNIKKKPR